MGGYTDRQHRPAQVKQKTGVHRLEQNKHLGPHLAYRPLVIHSWEVKTEMQGDEMTYPMVNKITLTLFLIEAIF